MLEEIWGPRGHCPRCGSEQVRHIVLGEPRPFEVATAPDWVEFAGCIFESFDDRACEGCGLRWQTDDEHEDEDEE